MLALRIIVFNVFTITELTTTVILCALTAILMITTATSAIVTDYNITRAGMQTTNAYGVLSHSG